MRTLNVDLKCCYGIKSLKTAFDFKGLGNIFVIYAPNGVMKTSFARTFRDLSESKETVDRIWTENKTVRTISDENGNALLKEDVFVIEPYNEGYRSEKISTLLVNERLRKRYEEIHQEIDERVEVLVKELKPLSGLKNGVKEAFSSALTHDPNDFFRALGRVKDEVTEEADSSMADVLYSDLFNQKVEAVLSDASFRSKLTGYIEKYEELLRRSTFFKKGIFTHNNASEIAKNLNANGFFKANHSVYLRINGEKKEVSSLKDLETAIQSEKNMILTDDRLQSAFEAMDKQLNKNAELKAFRTALEKHPIIIPELTNPDRLKQKLWVSYLVRSKDSYESLLEAHTNAKDEIGQIVEEAKDEQTRWADVIHIFNERFSVPFVVRMENQEDVILKSTTPRICFDFLEDSADRNSATTSIEESDLQLVLSNGEKRALYILNIIFEVEARKTAGQQTLFIVDDIADSFDYKNKYAIIEYLKEMQDEGTFKQIILSHNFDFFRTVSSRLGIKRKCRLLASKTSNGIVLREEIYQRSAPFSHWSEHFSDLSMLIASIPFLRNLAEFLGDDSSYGRLTSLLHIKSDTHSFLIRDLEQIIKDILHNKEGLILQEPDKSVIDVIKAVATKIASDTSEEASLEEKIVLSIAIRLLAEEFMILKIKDQTFWNGITINQTVTLLKRYKSDFPHERENIRLFDQVNLMTPENIHLNSFMYEPILDLSAHHLKRLHRKILALDNTPKSGRSRIAHS